MKSKLKWNTISVMKASLFVIITLLIIGIFKKELLFFGLGGLVALMHFYMIFGAIQNNRKASNYITRAAFLILSILGALWSLGNNFWYFLPGLFLVKGIVIIFVGFDMILRNSR